MNIELKNIALIEEGDLELKGITLIADENDSGKSTIGKTLFTTLTTLNNFEKEFLTNLSQRIEVSYFSLKSISEESLDNNEIKTRTNNNGGILGGLSTGMPLVFSVVVKPTSSISLEQKTVNIKEMKEDILKITGRHDACIVPRVLPVIEAVMALAILDEIL